MKKILLLLAAVAPAATMAQLQQNDCLPLFEIPDDRPPLVLEPGDTVDVRIACGDDPAPRRRYLRVVGGAQQPGDYAPRGESYYRRWEFHIDDRLDSIHTAGDRYALYFDGDGEQHERLACNRIGAAALAGGPAVLSANVRREELAAAAGWFGIEIEIFLRREGRHPDDIYDAPDRIVRMPVAPGSGGYERLAKSFELPDQVAALVVKAGGAGFSGRAWIDGVTLSQPGREPVRLPFVPYDERPDHHDYWVGIDLMTRNRPMWRLEIDGRTHLHERRFDRASNVADLYFELPDDLRGDHDLKLTLEPEAGKRTLPYAIRRVQLLSESRRDFEIVAAPRYPAVGDTVALLVEVNRPECVLEIDADSALRPLQPRTKIARPGLAAIPFTVEAPACDLAIRLRSGGEERTARIAQSLVRGDDGVYLSSGDEIHIDNTAGGLYDHFFKWYVRERIGNWYQFRPSNQWSGVRHTPQQFLDRYLPLLEALRMPYAWQVEGRTLASAGINPPLEALAGPMFRGKQAHENDGNYYYWQHFPYTGLCSDMAARTRPLGGIFAKHRPIFTDHGTFIHYDPYAVTDMADGAARYVANLASSRGESTRHTGPSTSFRYLFQAGYEWLGAEQMYGPEETVMSSLRGASLAYGKREFGSLHAMQWGSFPFTDPAHAERFFLSLAVAYIHGSSHLNTEEGLWTDEYAHDRYTPSGRLHLRAQHALLDFIETHTRRGEMRPRIAVLQGRNDAWKCFSRASSWSQEGEKWRFGRANESFDLLRIFYPENVMDANIGGDAVRGWFTSTPYGPVDLLPVEAPASVLARYDVLIFLGWNSYDRTDFERIAAVVHAGGTLVMTAAHANEELQPDLPPRFPHAAAPLRRMLGRGFERLDGRNDLVYGKGRIVYFAEPLYPADPQLRPRYEAAIREIAGRTVQSESARGWIRAAAHIGFTAWDAAGRRTLYVLNNDWEGSAPSRSARLLFAGNEFEIEVPRWRITAIHCFDDVAVLPSSDTADVLGRTADGAIEVQCTAPATFRIFRSDGSEQLVGIARPGIRRIE